MIMRHYILSAVCAGCLVCASVPVGWAAEALELQNRKNAPAAGSSTPPAAQGVSPTPAQPGGPTPSSPSGPAGDPAGVKGTVTPGSGTTTVIVPGTLSPGTAAPEAPRSGTGEPPVVLVPVTPAAPAVPVAPASPVAPEDPSRSQVIVVPEIERPQATPARPEALPPKEEGPLTPESFLIKTPEPEKAAPQPERRAEAKPEKKPEKQPEKKAEARPERTPESKAEQKPEDKTPKKGDPLRIPEEAKQTGQLDFLEGCWIGTRPEYHTKRIVTERFCFGKDGVGKRFILDPQYAGQCVGATRAVLNQGGVLRMQSEKMYCSNTSDNWGASEMTCRGEGDQTPCTWVFNDVTGNPQQSYTIRFVRE